jgi:hypothetical protein
MYSWTGAGFRWGIVVANVPPGKGEEASANIRVQDPVMFPNLNQNDKSFDVQFDPAGSWSNDFPLQDHSNGLVYNAAVTITGDATSNLFGYAKIFDYTINLAPGQVSVSVHSTRALRWDDTAVAEQIAHAYTWDGEYMTYTGGPLVAANIPVFGFGTGPGLQSAQFSLSEELTATATYPSIR